MATKKILVSDGSGSTEEIRSSSIGYNDVTNQISASKITAYNLSSSLPTGVLLANGNFISSSVISATGQPGSLLQFSGSAYRLNLPTAIGGDLSGSTTALDAVKVISVANVSSGTLPFLNGGTGLTSELSGVLIKGADNTLQVLATADTGSVIGLKADGWFIDNTDPTTNYVRRVEVITLPSYTWTKKGNPRFLNVTIVGGGGGGGSGGSRPGAINSQSGGGGGAGGGVTQILLEAANVSGATITNGSSGSGGFIPASTGNPTNGFAGASGGSTFFSCSLGNFYATGGGGGNGATAANTTGGISGGGSIPAQDQAGGASVNTADGVSGNNGVYTSGGGGGGGFFNSQGRNGGSSGVLLFSGDRTVSASAGVFNASSGGVGKTYVGQFTTYYLNGDNTTLYSIATRPIFGTGGGGGGMSTTAGIAYAGGNAASGSGGGGGGSYNGPGFVSGSIKPHVGGNGGNGFVIIESY